MKQTFTIILITVATLFSCKEDSMDDVVLNATTAEEIQKVITTGYWQLDLFKYPNETTYMSQTTFYALKFVNDINFDEYKSKGVKHNNELWYYRVKEINKKAYLVRYASEENYKKDTYADYQAYGVRIENNELILTYIDEARIDIFKWYNSMADTKNLPSSN